MSTTELPGLAPMEYRSILERVHVLRELAARLDGRGQLDAALAAIDRADAVGAIVDPTLYRDRAPAMAEDREVLAAVRDLAHLGSGSARRGSPASTTRTT